METMELVLIRRSEIFEDHINCLMNFLNSSKETTNKYNQGNFYSVVATSVSLILINFIISNSNIVDLEISVDNVYEYIHNVYGDKINDYYNLVYNVQ